MRRDGRGVGDKYRKIVSQQRLVRKNGSVLHNEKDVDINEGRKVITVMMCVTACVDVAQKKVERDQNDERRDKT